MLRTNRRFTKGFTLLEILLVVAIISILAGIVIIAINPSRQLGQARDAQRKSDLNTIYKAVSQYYLDNARYQPLGWSGVGSSTDPIQTWSTSADLREVCSTGNMSYAEWYAEDSNLCDNLIDLSYLVPTYVSAIPVDPVGSLASIPFIKNVLAAVTGTGYKIVLVGTSLFMTAPRTEIGGATQKISTIGTVPSGYTVPAAGQASPS